LRDIHHTVLALVNLSKLVSKLDKLFIEIAKGNVLRKGARA
jgi:hypothetical protein